MNNYEYEYESLTSNIVRERDFSPKSYFQGIELATFSPNITKMKILLHQSADIVH